MDGISKKITNRPGFLQVIFDDQREDSCFKEATELLCDNGHDCFRDE